MPPFGSVTSMPTVVILPDLMFVPAKLDMLEMGKLAAVRTWSCVIDNLREFLTVSSAGDVTG